MQNRRDLSSAQPDFRDHSVIIHHQRGHEPPDNFYVRLRHVVVRSKPQIVGNAAETCRTRPTLFLPNSDIAQSPELKSTSSVSCAGAEQSQSRINAITVSRSVSSNPPSFLREREMAPSRQPRLRPVCRLVCIGSVSCRCAVAITSTPCRLTPPANTPLACRARALGSHLVIRLSLQPR